MQLSTKIRAAITTVAAVAALSSGAAGVASAGVSVTEPGDGARTTTGELASPQRTTRPVPTDPQPVAPVEGPNVAKEGAATGDGPADDEECEDWGHKINVHIDLAEGARQSGDVWGYVTNLAAASAAEDAGSDRGCFFIDEPADID
jgi:hypothetical protein